MFTALSCQKSDIETVNQDSEKVVQEFESSDKYSKRVLFNILKPQERYMVWVHAFNKLIDVGGLNAKQKSLLTEAKSSLTPELYDEANAKLREAYLSIFTQQWLIKAKSEFTEEQLSSVLSLPLSGLKILMLRILIKRVQEQAVWVAIATEEILPIAIIPVVLYNVVRERAVGLVTDVETGGYSHVTIYAIIMVNPISYNKDLPYKDYIYMGGLFNSNKLNAI